MATFKGITLPNGETYLPEGGEGEWQLFQTITGDGETLYFEFDSLDFTEFLFVCTGLTNISESTSSVLQIRINGNVLSTVSTQSQSGASETKSQFSHLKYNGLYWEQQVLPVSSNASGYYGILANIQAPYSYDLEIGKCNILRVTATVSNYTLASGTIQIYAR